MAQTPDFATKPTLTGPKVVLRPFVDDDLPDMLAAVQDPEAVKLTGSAHDDATAAAPMDAAARTVARDWYATRNEQAGRLDLAVIDRGSGQCVGEAVLNEWDAGNRSCSFRILIGAAGRGRGLGTEATRLIIGHGFGFLGLHRISLEVYSFNPRARHVYEKAGFRAEGVLREALRYNDQWIDATVMSILDHEWAAVTASRPADELTSRPQGSAGNDHTAHAHHAIGPNMHRRTLARGHTILRA